MIKMKTNNLMWINLLSIFLLAALAAILIVVLAQTRQTLIASVGWHGFCSVGWVN